MQRIPIKFAAAGMITGKPVAKSDGMVLVGEGTTLTEAVIERLRNSGITSLAVKGRPLPGLDSGLNLVKLKGRLNHLFRKYQQDPLMWTLRNMLEQYFDRYIAAQEEAQRAEREEQLAAETQPDVQN